MFISHFEAEAQTVVCSQTSLLPSKFVDFRCSLFPEMEQKKIIIKKTFNLKTSFICLLQFCFLYLFMRPDFSLKSFKFVTNSPF